MENTHWPISVVIRPYFTIKSKQSLYIRILLQLCNIDLPITFANNVCQQEKIATQQFDKMSIIRESFRFNKYNEPTNAFATIFLTIQTNTNDYHGENHQLSEIKAKLYGRISKCEGPI